MMGPTSITGDSGRSALSTSTLSPASPTPSASQTVSPTSPTFVWKKNEAAMQKGSHSSSLSQWRLAAITMSILGVQTTWSILMSHGNPYLSSLGFSSALSSLVWLAGPLGGTIVQPMVGMWSDTWSIRPRGVLSKLGRRRPFILVGAFVTFASMFALSTIKEFFEATGYLSGVSHRVGNSSSTSDRDAWLVKAVAIFWVYLVNLGIQPLQVGVRAYVVDCVPSSQQVDASAWISRWNSLGAVITFWIGSRNLPEALPALGTTQFQVLAILDGLVLLIAIPVSFLAGKGLGDDTPRERHPATNKRGLLQTWRRLYRSWKVMPQTCWIVCRVQFWAWMAWFPFLYYNTLYIASLDTQNVSKWSSVQAAIGTATATATSSLHPTSTSFTHAVHSATKRSSEQTTAAVQAGAFASFLFALTSLGFVLILPSLHARLKFLNVPALWLASHLVFALIMALTTFTDTVTGGTLLVACLGYSWAMTQWAPYALIGREISKLGSQLAEDTERAAGVNLHDSEGAGGAGAILGLHNVAISGPQIIAAIECSLLFGLFDMFGVKDDIGWVLRLTGFAAFGAAWMTRDLLRIST